jgi:phosphoribosyl 1,2-cyclic phosphate phosphodiesterase
MKITILGSGASSGTPVIGCKCSVCTSNKVKNFRTRASIFIEHKDTKILIDTSPDLRQQALNNNINAIDAVLYTHEHADHIAGIDDLKSFSFIAKHPLPIYSDIDTLTSLRSRFEYIFLKPDDDPYNRKFAFAEANIIECDQAFIIKNLEFAAFKQTHGKKFSLGFRSENFAYSTDVNNLNDDTLNKLTNLDLWIVDCARYKANPTHSHLEQTLSWIAKVKPKLAVLTHLSHEIDYDSLSKTLPENIVPAYDSMEIVI